MENLVFIAFQFKYLNFKILSLIRIFEVSNMTFRKAITLIKEDILKKQTFQLFVFLLTCLYEQKPVLFRLFSSYHLI